MTRFLLDTHVLLWLLTAPDQLDRPLRETLADPFDRMLVAQAASEGLTLVTRDPLARPRRRGRVGPVTLGRTYSVGS